MRYLLLPLLGVATLLSGCSDALDEGTMESGEGGVALQMSFIESRAMEGDDYTEAMETSVLKVYSGGSLIRRYEPATTVPEYIYLLAGDYTVTVLVGDETETTFEKSEATYYGEESFTITSGAESVCNVTCTMQNTLVEISFDETIEDKFESYSVCVVAAESYSDEAVEALGAIVLSYSEDGTGYFLLTDSDYESLAWRFSGEFRDQEGEDKLFNYDGVISKANAAECNSLAFSYTTRLNVETLKVEVDESTEDHDDSFSFAVQPVFSAVGFDTRELQPYDGVNGYTYNLTSVNVVESVTVSVDGVDYTPFAAGAEVALSNGISYAMTDTKNGVLTISNDWLQRYVTGGERTFTLKATDDTGTLGTTSLDLMVSGAEGHSGLDMWLNQITLSARYTKGGDETVKIQYKTSAETTWSEVDAVMGDDYSYSATLKPNWIQTDNNNSSAAVYYYTKGLVPATTYEYRLVVGSEVYESLTFTTDSTSQAIPDYSFESDDLECWTSEADGGGSSWGSGNNSWTKELCSQKSGISNSTGTYCAYLEATKPSLGDVLASGNVFLGTFYRSGSFSTSGTVRFGQAFNWDSRPRQIKFKYAATLGSVDYTQYYPSGYSSAVLASGSTDQGRIYFAIVDWSARHEVTAGTSAPVGAWDPATQTETDEGNIIGYASLFITEDLETLTETTLDIYYYDKETKPTGQYSIVISCATSAYGDYMNGSTSSKMWVDDFQLVY